MVPAFTCRELVELVTDYLEGALAPEDRLRFEQHVAICPGCRTYVDQMRLTIRTMGNLTEASIAPEAKQALLRVFRSWRRAEQVPPPDDH
ncbi:MAG TPA: zf-HC2 domain-containing protein [Chloroflexota bacterium]|jgi:anti-sigma factor RsiW|nr:zf-HC2 domain-containing protein [Chloroflexota bacterium]